MNKISRAINSNTETINRNLQNLPDSLHDQNTRFDLFEAVVTLIIQEQHFLTLLGKIKRSFVFTEEVFNLEILTHEQISNVKSHLSELYSPEELILHYHNLLDFRFVQGSIVTIHDSIIYTIKIPVLNPIEFSLFQRLAIINQYNQTEIVVTPWILDRQLIKLFSKTCQLIYQYNICYQVTAEKTKSIIISSSSPLVLAYLLSYNLTLISTNCPIEIGNDKNITILQGTQIIYGNNILIQGHNINDNVGEFKQPEIQPLIIENYQRSFEPLKTLAVPTIATPEFKIFGVEFHTSITSPTIVLLLLFIGIIYLIYKHINKNIQNTQTTPKDDEDVLQIGRGGVI